MQQDVQHDNAGLTPIFYTKPMKNEPASAECGYPVYVEQERIRIMIAGDKENIIDRKANDEDRNRFADAYARFKRKAERSHDGTPLEEWPQLATTQVAMLKEFNIFTVQMLANVPDTSLGKMGPGARDLKSKAQNFLNNDAPRAAQSEKIAALQADNDTLRAEVAEMKEQIAAMAAANAKTAEPVKKASAK